MGYSVAISRRLNPSISFIIENKINYYHCRVDRFRAWKKESILSKNYFQEYRNDEKKNKKFVSLN
jgi:hypothetical protein